MANQFDVDGKTYISMDYLIGGLVRTCLQYHSDGYLGCGESENESLRFVEYLLKRKMPITGAYDAFARSYVHQKYPQIFGKEKES